MFRLQLDLNLIRAILLFNAIPLICSPIMNLSCDVLYVYLSIHATDELCLWSCLSVFHPCLCLVAFCLGLSMRHATKDESMCLCNSLCGCV